MGKIIHLDADAFFASVEQSTDARLRGIPMAVGGEIGPKTSLRLNAAGLADIGQIAAMPVDLLALIMGNQAPQLRQFAHGIDERPLLPASEPQKSYSKQETFGEDVTDEEYVEAVLRKMADQLFADVRAENRSVRTLTVKVRYNDRDENSRAESLREPTDLETDIYGKLRGMLKEAWQRRVSLRMVSLKLSNVYNGVFRTELSFDAGTRNHEAQERLAVVLDDLRRKHRRSIVMRGHDLRLREPPRDLVKSKPQIKIIFQARRPVFPKIKTYIPLRVRSHFTFLDSTLSPAAIVKLAGRHEMSAIALTDIGNLHGAVEFAQEAKRAGIKSIFGTELNINGQPLLLHVESPKGYQNLNKLLSVHAESNVEEDSVATKQRKSVKLDQLATFSEGLIAISGNINIAEMFPGRFYQLLTRKMAKNHFPVVACPEIHYGVTDDRLKFDIVQSIRTRTLLRQDHPEKRITGKLHFRTPAEMFSACRENPEWLENLLEIAERCNFKMPFGKRNQLLFH